MILHAGANEPLKAGLHGTATVLLAAFTGYNAAAALYRWWHTGEVQWHLVFGAALYAPLTAFEATRTRDHVRSARGTPTRV